MLRGLCQPLPARSPRLSGPMVRTFQGQESPDPGIPCVLISDDAGRRVHAALDQGPEKNMLRHDPIDVISLSDGGLIKATKKR